MQRLLGRVVGAPVTLARTSWNQFLTVIVCGLVCVKLLLARRENKIRDAQQDHRAERNQVEADWVKQMKVLEGLETTQRASLKDQFKAATGNVDVKTKVAESPERTNKQPLLARSPTSVGGPDVYVKSKGRQYKVARLKNFIEFRDFALSQDSKWTTAFNDGKGMLVESRPEELTAGATPTGINIVRVNFEMPRVDPELLYDSLHDPDYRKSWDQNMLAGYNICNLDPRNDIGYYAAQSPVMIANRDFCNMRSWMEFTNGEYLIMNHSEPHADCPEKKGFVRGNSIRTGYYLMPLQKGSGKKGGCKMVYVSHTDIKGSLPGWVMNNAVTSALPKMMRNLEQCALNYEQWTEDEYPADFIGQWRTSKVAWDGTEGDGSRSGEVQKRAKAEEVPTTVHLPVNEEVKVEEPTEEEREEAEEHNRRQALHLEHVRAAQAQAKREREAKATEKELIVATSGGDGEEKKKKPSKTHMIRMLSYLSATAARFKKWGGSNAPLRNMIEISEFDRVEKALKRHGKTAQNENLRMPMDLMMGVLAFLPPSTARIRQSRTPEGKIQAVTGRDAVHRVMQCCGLTLFLVMENEYVMDPKKFVPVEAKSDELTDDPDGHMI